MPAFTMPQLGESDVEGTVLRWLKQPGEHVRAEEPLVEVETEKVNVEIPSPFEGTLTQILVQEGETVPVGTELAVIDGADLTPRPPSLAGKEEPGREARSRPTPLPIPGRGPMHSDWR
jgi:pyruvate dehydrogenase E2 component (dihydrolipoamide acetyltransferase)